MSLIAPWFLLGLAALFVPIVLHRFSHSEPDESSFPSTRFLEATRPPVSQKRRLRYRTLFSLRTLFLLLLCLLFAGPYLLREFGANNAKAMQLIALDQSLSMQAGDRWSTAVSQATELLEELPDSDQVQLLGFSHTVSRYTTEAVPTQEAIAILKTMTPGQSAADYGQLMQQIDRLARDSSLPVNVAVITDAQRNNLPSQLNALFAPGIASLNVIDVSDSDSLNYSLRAQAQVIDAVFVELDLTVSASVTDPSSPVTSTRRTLVISHQGEELERRLLDIEAGSSESLKIANLSLPERLPAVFTVELEEQDALEMDNSVSVVIQQNASLEVAMIATGADARAADVFVTTAIETDSLARINRSSSVAQLPTDVRYLVGFHDLAAADIPIDLQNVVDRGVSTLVIHSGEPDASDEMAKSQGVRVLDEAHPLGLGDIDWSGVRIFGVSPMPIKENERVLLATENNEPLLVERRIGNGIMLLINDNLTANASNFPLQPAFVVLMQGIVRYFDASTAIPTELDVGSRLFVPPNVQVQNRDGQNLVDIGSATSGQDIVLDETGVYTLFDLQGERLLNVSFDPAESDLSRMASAEVGAWEQRHVMNEQADDSTGGEVQKRMTADASIDDSLPMSRYLLPLLLLALILESLLANRRLHVKRDGS